MDACTISPVEVETNVGPDSQNLGGVRVKDCHELVLRYGVGRKVHPTFRCVPEAFTFQAKSNPELVAVEDIKDKVTYAELDLLSTRLAIQLVDIGVRADARVCLLSERSISFIVGLLGIMKAGAAYIPLDGNIITDTTLAHVLVDSQATAVVASMKFRERVRAANLPVICLEDVLSSTTTLGKAHSLETDICTSEHGAYVIYTSGTTGAPKGVDVTHGNVVNLITLDPGNLGMRPGLRVSQLLNISFDMAAWEILGSLCNGSTLCLRGTTAEQWHAVMRKVDILIATPSILLPHDPTHYSNIKTVAVAGEPCPQGLADAWGSGRAFYNCCGPTEITIVNTMQLHIPGDRVSIGGPTPNNTVYILDDNMNLVPPGAPGIMWAGGKGISRGYVNLPALTQERYKRDIFANDGSMMFNTGDLGRWLPNGSIEHLGRVDNQVKVKGFRVELDGVSAAMESCPGVNSAATLLIDGQLVGFALSSTTTQEDILATVTRIQPYYAVPSKVVVLKDFPKTANGKTDKGALRQLAMASNATPGHSSSPSTSQLSSSSESTVHNPSESSLGTTVPDPAADADKPSTSPSSLEKQEQPSWEGYENEDVSKKTQGKIVRNLRHQIFTLYRRLFGVVFIANMAVLVWMAASQELNAQRLGGVVIANLFASVLMRQDYVINVFFNIFCSVPTSWPLSIRRVCARVYHIGGLHSGFAISGIAWLLLFTVQATREVVQNGGTTSPMTLIFTYIILFLLIGIVALAYPPIRTKFHDRFERSHRFLGWSATALVWVQFVSLSNDYTPAEGKLGDELVHLPYFWLLMFMTLSIILPWARLRKVPVHSEVLSKHAVRLYFDYVTPIPGSFTRISDNPLMEWHSFATVSEPGKKGYSLVVSRAGDWTSKQIDHPPTHLWVRGVPTFGVLRSVPLFKKVVLVATGSGIGPCAPCILEQRVPMKVLWTSPDVRATFGDKFVDAILAAAPDTVLYDTRKHGKPDMVKLTYRLFKESGAEAVCVISNQKLTRKIVYGMMSRGIPAFGAIWDS